MKTAKFLAFLGQTVTVGLALAFVIVFIRPDLLSRQEGSLPDPGTNSGAASNAAVSYAAAVQKAAPAVVYIHTSKKVVINPLFNEPWFKERYGTVPQHERQSNSLGSGVIVSEQGHVLTSYHVIKGADQIHVTLRDGRTAGAQLFGSDKEADLAVLKIEGLEELPTITFSEQAGLHIGDVVLAIGNPFGFDQTVTMGIVSATGRNQLGINTFENFIQTDAAINPGNSGGALVNAYGDLVGINTAIYSRSGGSMGIGFAIPISMARDSMAQIIQYGRVRRGWLGIEIQALTPALAESFGLSQQQGVLIAGVLQNGPAAKAGLLPGDVIRSVGEHKVNTTQAVLNLIAATKPGDSIELAVQRGGENITITATANERPIQQD